MKDIKEVLAFLDDELSQCEELIEEYGSRSSPSNEHIYRHCQGFHHGLSLVKIFLEEGLNEPNIDEIIESRKKTKSRRSGRTIKLVDKAVNELFTNGEAIVKDHYDSRESHTDLLKLIIRRLHTEHGLNAEVNYDVEIERNYYKIYLK